LSHLLTRRTRALEKIWQEIKKQAVQESSASNVEEQEGQGWLLGSWLEMGKKKPLLVKSGKANGTYSTICIKPGQRTWGDAKRCSEMYVNSPRQNCP